MLHWRSSSAYAQGAGHKEAGTPCQDRAVHFAANGVQTIVLADGAGSYDFSHFGAETVVTGVAQYLCEEFNLLQILEPEELAGQLHRYIHSHLNMLVFEHDRDKEEFSSTLLFVAVKGEQYIAGHVGDGIIVKCQGMDAEVLSAPENGRYENETFFVSMKELGAHFRIYHGEITPDTAFIIMSDGSSVSFYNPSQGLDIENLSVIADHFRTAGEDTFAADLGELLTVLVDNTHDDCSIAVLAAAEQQPISIAPSDLMLAALEKAKEKESQMAAVPAADKTIEELFAPRHYDDDEEEEKAEDFLLDYEEEIDFEDETDFSEDAEDEPASEAAAEDASADTENPVEDALEDYNEIDFEEYEEEDGDAVAEAEDEPAADMECDEEAHLHSEEEMTVPEERDSEGVPLEQPAEEAIKAEAVEDVPLEEAVEEPSAVCEEPKDTKAAERTEEQAQSSSA
ncbi:PP2C family serine/threonine-protein phosphatase [Ectobacillus ponti]|uniref:Protein phosphatase 2C domain-containing protein n=1 Tax=Ectobacillus ponti TaxID=2961894 RepID=A0AA42BRQ7_9BACI|nr:PP2C family serine/threonine-protein phosphatase [Ectobacillus ponti]MCP8970631.1 protein phosphatase 2C domain-containing protein [Ectobacillus ponti]